ncbi:hypothetical protein BU24DRAFT_274034 [Aaosphaeria arxii CBS 175.79]|uniref:Inheritance of peroxisomes protein 1 n=1 Tax=Aaosphaeria arxii CBS 175.79 TaxID=1450172 RepID=A0A6A5XGI2_9PLEO|nr:uncharacterized protein BU24DRAFT_274034 [Aaosphaeria arxii CBS 175.79]KAF2012288.1 hypothetical protein BU24DRAFT_274034 [Aaosphaeria arxii CBS 175.79]
MSSPAPAPATSPEHPHTPPLATRSNPNLRRSYTNSSRPTTAPSHSHSHSTSSNVADGIETLFTSASAKIISFTASSGRLAVSPSRRRNAAIKTEPLPWTTITERTLAVGVLQIYRVTSSNVSFLNSGNLLHTIFPKSQCWCVDADSTFVLRVRMESYYRIELPCETEEDREKAEEFKSVLSQVLQYEKTPCPFRRGYEEEIEAEEQPKTPQSRLHRKAPERAKKWLFDKTWVPEDGPRPTTPSDSGASPSTRPRVRRAPPEEVPEMIESPKSEPMHSPSVRERALTFQGLRAFTLRGLRTPSGLGKISWPPVGPAEPESSPDEIGGSNVQEYVSRFSKSFGNLSMMSSKDSFHSIESPGQETPSPPYVDAETDLINPWAEDPDSEGFQRGRGRHRRQVSALTIRAQSSEPALPSPCTPVMNVYPGLSPSPGGLLSSPPSTPPLVSDSDEDSVEPAQMDVLTPPSAIRMRKLTGATQRRAFSPMPHPQNLFRPSLRHPTKRLTSELMRRTCELILGPPAHLVLLMLRIASKISNFGFNTYKIRASGQKKFPGSWESSEESEWDEDDFGIPLDNLEGVRRRRHMGEVD